jgi:hypothetical protein
MRDGRLIRRPVFITFWREDPFPSGDGSFHLKAIISDMRKNREKEDIIRTDISVRVNGSEYIYAGGGCPHCTNGFLIISPPESRVWRVRVYRCIKCARRFIEEKSGSLSAI